MTRMTLGSLKWGRLAERLPGVRSSSRTVDTSVSISCSSACSTPADQAKSRTSAESESPCAAGTERAWKRLRSGGSSVRPG